MASMSWFYKLSCLFAVLSGARSDGETGQRVRLGLLASRALPIETDRERCLEWGVPLTHVLRSVFADRWSCAGPTQIKQRALNVYEVTLGSDEGPVIDRCPRIVPSFRDGHPTGFYVFAISAGSLYAKLGFVAGDILRSVNGIDLSSPEKAKAIGNALKKAERVEVTIERRGQLLQKTYIMKAPRRDSTCSGMGVQP